MKQKYLHEIKLVAFDVNGTMFNDRSIFFAALNSIFEHFEKPTLSTQQLRKEFTQPWTKIYRERDISVDMGDDGALYKLYNRAYQEQARPRLAPGMKAALTFLINRRIPLVIVSTQQNVITLPLLEASGIARLFEEVIGGAADKARSLSELALRRSLQPEHIAYVGDQDSDVTHSILAGCVPLAYTRGVHTKERLRTAGAIIFLENHKHFPELPLLFRP